MGDRLNGGFFTRAWAAGRMQRLRSLSASGAPRLSTRGRLASNSANPKSLLHPETRDPRVRVRPSDHARGAIWTRRARRGPARGCGRAIAHLDGTRFERLRLAWRSLVQTAAAATVAYLIASELVGHRPTVLRSDRRDHHAGHHRRPARPARRRARARRGGRDRGRRCARAPDGHRGGDARGRRLPRHGRRGLPRHRPDLRQPGCRVRGPRGRPAHRRRLLGRALR